MNEDKEVNSSLNKFQLEADIVDEYKISCGEIYVTRNKMFLFVCSLCDVGYCENINDYLNHISTEHLADYESVIKNVSEENIEYDDVIDEIETDASDEKYISSSEGYEMYEPVDRDGIISNSGMSQENDEFVLENMFKTDDPTTTGIESNNVITSNEGVNLTGDQIDTEFAELNGYSIHDHRRYKCDQCDLTFKSVSSRNSHQRRHTGIKNHACTYCPKKFFTNTELKQHVRMHTGERPYFCSECGKAFSSSGWLTDHLERHKNVRSHKCEFCDKSFYTSRQKRSHLNTHTGERNHACTKCNATFALRKTMLRHMQLHTNEREYQCNVCMAQFIQKQNLALHMKTRHNMVAISNKIENSESASSVVEGNTTCSLCLVTFTSSASLLDHEQTMHVCLEEDLSIEMYL